MIVLRAIHFLGLGVFLVAAFMLGYILRPVPDPPKPVPAATSEQLTIAATTLLHGLEMTYGLALSSPPDFIRDMPTKAGGWVFDFRATYLDESSAVWEITLNRSDTPTLVRRLKSVVAPPPG